MKGVSFPQITQIICVICEEHEYCKLKMKAVIA
jgi:hypothetical protein